MTTPEKIESLKENQIFVFGSNLNGNHAGGAAALAKEKFGAFDGVGEGLTGQSYAFPTLNTKMKKVTKKALIDSKNKLYQCATENPTKQFLVTKVGCGIAGFTEKEMKSVFAGEKPSNVILPAGWAIIKGYKAFNKGLVCRGMQYEFGKDFYHKGKIELCASGLHFCKSLGNVYNYYSFGTDIDVCEIESDGDVIDQEDMEKSVTNHIRLVRILNPEEAKNNSGINNSGHSNVGDWNVGDRNVGDRNVGNWNVSSLNTGSFNTETPKEITVFNKKCSKEKWDNADKPSWLYFNLTEWVSFYYMTDEEKETYPSCKTTGGYLKKYNYKEAFQKSYNNASKEEQQKIKKLPNWNKKVFFEISGIMID